MLLIVSFDASDTPIVSALDKKGLVPSTVQVSVVATG
jgi:hypothetical protein